MNKSKKVKEIINLLFNNIPAYVQMYLELLQGSFQEMSKLFGPVGKKEQNEFMLVFTAILLKTGEAFRIHRKKLEKAMTRELNKLSMEDLLIFEGMMDPARIKRMTAMNFALLPAMADVVTEVITSLADIDEMPELQAFVGKTFVDMQTNPKPRKRAIVRKRTLREGLGKGIVRIKAAKRKRR